MFSVSFFTVFSSLLLPPSCFSSVESFLQCSKCRRWLLYTLPIEWATQWVKQCYDAWSQARLLCISCVDLFSPWNRLFRLRKREARRLQPARLPHLSVPPLPPKEINKKSTEQTEMHHYTKIITPTTHCVVFCMHLSEFESEPPSLYSLSTSSPKQETK